MTEDDYLRRERECIVEFDGKEDPLTARRVAEVEASQRDAERKRGQQVSLF